MTLLTGPVRPLMFVLAALAGLALTAGQTPAASNFDGEWSVLIITEAGSCDRAYRYPVRVTNGVLKYEGEASVDDFRPRGRQRKDQRNGPARRAERERIGPAFGVVGNRKVDRKILNDRLYRPLGSREARRLIRTSKCKTPADDLRAFYVELDVRG